MAITLQNILDASSYILGETGGTPTAQLTIRTKFANEAKVAIRDMQNWSWERQDGDAINYTYTPGSTTYSYTLSPSAGAIKNKDAIIWVKFTDQNGTINYLDPVDEASMNNEVQNNGTDWVYWLKGNDKLGYSLIINAGPLPTQNVTGAITYAYYAKEADFAAGTDTTAIPKEEVLAWFIASKVLYGYREQAQYQLANTEFQNCIDDMLMMDQKAQPYEDVHIKSKREALGASNDYRTYF